jgi:flagellar hook protein FlgE
MSLSGALTSAVTGLDAQSAALGAISDNVSNSQTTGYKRVDTEFSTLLTVSNAFVHEPGGVLSHPLYTNDIQGSIQSTSTSTNLAVTGSGYFAVSRVNGFTGTTPTFEPAPLFTRAGDFALDNNSFLVNGAGLFLNGFPVDPITGAVQKGALQQVRVTALTDPPTATTAITYSANLPSAPSTTAAPFPPTTVSFLDALGQPHNLDISWQASAVTPGLFTATFSSSDPAVSAIVATGGATATTQTFQFEVAAGNPIAGGQAGSLMQIGAAAGTAGTPALQQLQITLGSGAGAPVQNVDLNLGTLGVAGQTTMFTGTEVNFISSQQDGKAPGNFSNLAVDAHGFVTLNYDNGDRKTVFQIPLAQFPNFDALQPQNGNAFSATQASGAPGFNVPGANGSGTIVGSSIEASNVDIAAEFTKMIVAQKAYSANTRVITVTNQLLDETNNIIR